MSTQPGVSDKLIGSEVISTSTLSSLSIDAIHLAQAFRVFCPSLGRRNPTGELQIAIVEENWCDKQCGCPAMIDVAGGQRQTSGEFLSIDKGKSWQSKPRREMSSVGKGFAFSANGAEAVDGAACRIKP